MLDLDAIEARAETFAKRYPWRLEEGAKDYLARDRAALVAEVRRLQAVIDEACGWMTGSVPLGVPVARHLDALLAKAYRVLRGFE